MSIPNRASSRRKRRKEPLLKACLFGSAGALLTFALCLFVFSAILCGTENPGPLYLPLALFSMYAGALAAGILSVRFSGDGVVSGLLGGSIYAAVVFLLSLLPLPSASVPSSVGHILLLLALPTSVLGSVLGRRKVKKPSLVR